MPRRRYTTLTKQDIKTLKNTPPAALKALLVIATGILAGGIGIFFVILFSTWLYASVNLRIELIFGLATFAILALIAFILITVVWISASIITKHKDEIRKKQRAIQIANIDTMTGIEFEHYLQALLSHRGYSVQETKASGDLGVDLIASGNTTKFAIQVKRYTSKVPRTAISDAIGGMSHYGCNKAMVITNNYFTRDAITLAQSTGCILIDRDILASWIIEFQKSPLQ